MVLGVEGGGVLGRMRGQRKNHSIISVNEYAIYFISKRSHK